MTKHEREALQLVTDILGEIRLLTYGAMREVPVLLIHELADAGKLNYMARCLRPERRENTFWMAMQAMHRTPGLLGRATAPANVPSL